MQRHQIFYSRCSVKSKVCNLIINNGSCVNVMSRALVDYLKPETMPHRHPYSIGWIKKDPSIKLTDLCHVPMSIDKFYQDSLVCDVVDMDKCHIFWGDHDNMMLQLIKIKKTSIYSIGRAKELP